MSYYDIDDYKQTIVRVFKVEANIINSTLPLSVFRRSHIRLRQTKTNITSVVHHYNSTAQHHRRPHFTSRLQSWWMAEAD